MNLLPRWFKNPPVWVTLVLVVAIAGWQVWNVSAIPSRMSPALREIVAQEGQPVDVVVRVGFKLEAFHLNYFQDQARVGAVEDHQVLLRRVPPEQVEEIARNYWISQIFLADELN